MITDKLYMNLYSPALKAVKKSLEDLKENDPESFEQGFNEELEKINEILKSYYNG